jgi:hypothetical protein
MRSLLFVTLEYISGGEECQRTMITCSVTAMVTKYFDKKWKKHRNFPVNPWIFSNAVEWLQNEIKNCNKNVIIFQKGVAICKQVCYNTVTYIKN